MVSRCLAQGTSDRIWRIGQAWAPFVLPWGRGRARTRGKGINELLQNAEDVQGWMDSPSDFRAQLLTLVSTYITQVERTVGNAVLLG